ncbi:MAG: CheR family methyltransferase [Actinomycetota bacterium]
MTEHLDEELEALLEYLKHSRAFDFTGYKRSTLSRRLRKRMGDVGIASFGEYVDYLEVHPDEFAVLFNTILINVTHFFRDKAAWDTLATDVIPQIIASKGPQEPIRVWSAGCASGEEPYSIAITLAEALGPEAFRERVKVYGTDVDEEALTQARQGSYTSKNLEDVGPGLRDRYFVQQGDRFVFRDDLRRCIIYGRHDLVQDAPISRLDIVLCRNLLMYFNSDAQSRILDHLHFALNDAGVLFLGKAEMLLAHSDRFSPLDLKHRIFKSIPAPIPRRRAPGMRGVDALTVGDHVARQVRLRDAAFEVAPVAQIVVDVDQILILANDQARSSFNVAARDVGRPLQDLEISYRPAELRSRIEQVFEERRTVTIANVERATKSGDLQTFDVRVAPIMDGEGGLLGASVMFTDMTRIDRMQEEIQRSTQELETAYEELQSTNEELETTNEELQSTVEELETTNEELQSTNEELETTNEELQSTNEELQTINDDSRITSDELKRLNSFFELILMSVRVGVVVVDRDLQIRVWNKWAEDLWGLRTEEVLGRRLGDLDIGLPMDDLAPAIQSCLSGTTAHEVIIVPALNRRGRRIICRVGLASLAGIRESGVVVMMEETDAVGDSPPD